MKGTEEKLAEARLQQVVSVFVYGSQGSSVGQTFRQTRSVLCDK